jgi:DNA-binding transcriptional LysR family regulator
MRGSEFAELQALSEVVRTGSFSAAAAGLRMSRSALSQTIRRLEERLGVPLLLRSTRSVSPTEAGTTLLLAFDPAALAIADAVAAAQEAGGRVAGRLTLHTQRLGYETILAPALPAFLAAHPDVVLDIRIDDAPVDIISGGFDAGIRLGELLDRDMIAVTVGPELRQVAVASPDYLARYGRPDHPRELLSHRCIAFRWPGVDAIYDWEFTDPDTGEEFAVPITGPLVLSEQRAGIEAAAAGAGIAFWVESEIRPLVDTGVLEVLLDRWCVPFQGFSIYYPSRRNIPALRALIEHLRRLTPIVP